MLRKENEMTRRGLGKFEGVELVDIISKEESDGNCRLFAKCIIQPGAEIGIHRHEGDLEACYMIKGCLTVTESDRKYVIEPGDVQVCFDGETHGVRNDGTEPAEFVALVLYRR